jgi:hypothetical protein
MDLAIGLFIVFYIFPSKSELDLVVKQHGGNPGCDWAFS